MASSAPVNRLAHSTSPYLLQHAHNPVAWQPWDEAALRQARQQDRPIFLSIGYSACHWCHVMERESFEDAAVAAVLNEAFVCIKVDREERPDVDSIYMAATTALNDGRGGWPMSVFLTPEQKPFFAGTYFPPQDRGGMPGFRRVVEHIGGLWRSQRDTLLHSAEAITQALREGQQAAPAAGEVVFAQADARALAHIRASFEPRFGGFGEAPKFPQATRLAYVLGRLAEQPDEVAAGLREVLHTSLHGMGRGGLCDQIGGGFARYSTDAHWLVPHFEKMLYDNAELGKLYAQAAVALRDPFCEAVARRAFDFVLRDWSQPQGGFFASFDADSEGHEGLFYLWTPAQIEAVLPAPQSAWVCQAWDISDAGNWEGRSIPNLRDTLAQSAAKLRIDVATLQATLDEARPHLLAARAQRVAPALDDKVLCAWNGLMIGALAQGARLLQVPAWRAAACAAADFVRQHLGRGDCDLWRSFRAGQAGIEAMLEDYAYLCEGLIDLYEAGASADYLHWAQALAQHLLDAFYDADSGVFYTTARDHSHLLWRTHEGNDGATANAHATAALALARLHAHLQVPAFEAAAHQATRAYDATLARAPWAFAKLLQARAFVTLPRRDVVVCGTAGAADFAARRAAAGRHFAPRQVLAHGAAGEVRLPLLADKPVGTAVYVCEGRVCGAPLRTPAEVDRALGA